MVSNFNTEFDIIILGLLVITALLTFTITGTVIYIVRLRKSVAQHGQTLDRMQPDLNAMCSGTVTLGKHLASLEERLRSMQQRQDQFELHETSDRSYNYAKKMAKNGAKLGEVVEDCGIAEGEAELIFLSNQMDRAS